MKSKPTWSNEILRTVMSDHLTNASKVIQIDFHTGLGPSGYGELITEYELGSAGYALAEAWLGDDFTSTHTGTSSSAKLVGTTDSAFHDVVRTAEALSIALEFGTQPSDKVFAATRADQWVHFNVPEDEIMSHPAKQAIRDAFYVDTGEWKAQVLARADEVIGRAVRALSR